MQEIDVHGNTVSHPRRRVKPLWLAIVAIVLILCGLGFWLHEKHVHTARQNTAHSDMLSRSNKLIAVNQYSLAEDIIKRYLATNPPTGYRRDAMSQLAVAYSAAGDLQSALAWYKNIVQLDGAPHLDTVVGLAYTYQALKDNQNAIKYFQQAIALEQNTSSPDKTSVIATYQYLIRQLGGST